MQRLEYSNPIQPERISLRDPFILPHHYGYYLFSTRCEGPDDGFDAYFSRDLVNWSFSGEVYQRLSSGGWNSAAVRRPMVYARNGRYYLLYTADSSEGRSGIGIATANSPLGPFVDGPYNPLVGNEGEGAEAQLFTDPGGTNWLIYVQINPPNGSDRIVAQRVSADLSRLVDQPISLIDSDTIDWMKRDNTGSAARPQGPGILTREGMFYLMCSGPGDYGGTVGCFTARRMEGPYRSQGPVLRRDVGHNSWFLAPDGRTLLTCYHSPAVTEDEPKLCLDELRILADGTLYIDESRNQTRFIPMPGPGEVADHAGPATN